LGVLQVTGLWKEESWPLINADERDRKHEDSRIAAGVETESILEEEEFHCMTYRGSPRMMMRVYYSSYHLWAAQKFAERAAEVERRSLEIPRFDIEQRAYVTGAILSAVAFMEAAINELFQDVADNEESYISPLDGRSRDLIRAFWELSGEKTRALEKYQMALTFCGCHQLATGAQPYQDAELVIRLRNELMHYKPETLGGGAQHKLVRRLPNKFPDNPLMLGSANPYFPDKCLGSGCAKWAVQSTKGFADEFFQRIGMCPNYLRAKF
jgi:hypothetical protein